MLLLVAVASAVGAPTRYLVDGAVRRRLGAASTHGIVLVNVAGSFILGLTAGLATAGYASTGVVAFVGTGFCGALTTFSTFSYETVRLVEEESWRPAALNVAVSLGGALLAAAAGLGLARLIGAVG